MIIKKKKQQAGSEGVRIEELKVSMHKDAEAFAGVGTLFVMLAGSFGSVAAFLTGFDFQVSLGLYAFVIFLMCIFWIAAFKSRYCGMLVMFVLIGELMAGVICYRLVIESAETISSYMNGHIPANGSTGPGIVLMGVCSLVVIAVGWITVRKPGFLYASVISLGICSVPMFYGRFSSPVALTGIAIFLAGIAAADKKENQEQRRTGAPSGAAGLVVLAICILLAFMIPSGRYKRVKLFEDIRTQVNRGYEKTGIEDDLEKKFGKIAAGGINGGELGQVDSVEYQDKTMLIVKTGTISDIMYLRGFVGADYSSNCWNQLSTEKTNKYREVFDMAERNGIDVYSQSAFLDLIIDNDTELMSKVAGSVEAYREKVLKRRFRLQYYGASRLYWYLPYGNVASGTSKSAPDGYPQNIQDQQYDSYSFEMDGIDYDRFRIMIDNYTGKNQDLLEYIKWERQYRNMVYDLYTENSGAESAYFRQLADSFGTSTLTEMERQQFIAKMKKYFSENYTYTLSPGVLPEGKDFVTYFLKESRKGYCTYFASSAVMILRAAGIPARYVEGYVVNTADLKNSSGTQVTDQRNSTLINILDTYTQYTVAVTDRYAHAWVEIYNDGYGWVPLEVTPGMQSMEYNNDDSANVIRNIAPLYNDEDYNSLPAYDNAADEEYATLSEGVVEKFVYNTGHRVDYRKVGMFMLEVLIKLLEIICMIAAAAGILYMIHAFIKKRLEKAFDSRRVDTAEQIRDVYSYMERICRFLKLEKDDSMPYEEYAGYLCDSHDGFTVAEIRKLIDLVMKAKFGSEEAIASITDADVKDAVESVRKLRKNVYENAKPIKRFIFRFWYHLY